MLLSEEKQLVCVVHIHGAYVSVLGLRLILFKIIINRLFQLDIHILIAYFSLDYVFYC